MHYDDLRTRHIAQRWSVLAEKRLNYLTELFETGRWRRFHNEVDFLANIQEAKDAVERWRAMAAGQFVAPVLRDVPAARPALASVRIAEVPVIDLPSFEAPAVDADMEPVAHEVTEREELRPVPHLVAINDRVDLADETPTPEPVSEQPAAMPYITDWSKPMDLDAIRERYPILRAAM